MKTLPSSVLLMAVVLGASVCAHAQFSFGPAQSLAVGTSPADVVLADFDGDGNRDAAATSHAPDKVGFLFNDGAGNLGAPVNVSLGGGLGAHAMVAADLDGDGDIDMAVTLKTADQLQVLLNQGGGTFIVASTLAIGADARFLASGDLDGDGGIDLISSDRSADTVTVMLNSGAGTFVATSLAVGSKPSGIATGDLDGDGDVDVAVSSKGTREVIVLLNDGAGSLAIGPALSLDLNLRPLGLVATDLDADGDVDLAATASAGGLHVVSVFMGNGMGGFTGPVNVATGGIDPIGIAAGDLDADGDVDLVTANSTSNNLSLLPNDGAGSFGAATVLAVGLLPAAVAVGDLDGDGGNEIFTANQGSGDLSLLANQAPVSAFVSLGSGLAGTHGVPVHSGTGTLLPFSTGSLDLTSALEQAPVAWVIGFSVLNVPLKGGVLVPSPDILISGVSTDALGELHVPFIWPGGIPTGTLFVSQIWIVDAAAPEGFAASNAVQGTVP